MKKIFKDQKKIINLAKNYNASLSRKKIDISTSPLTYMTTWVETPGYHKLIELRKKVYKGKFKFFIKDILAISRLHDLEAIGDLYDYDKNLNLIISYCTLKNFDKKGDYYDEYFGTKTNKKNFIWLLISLDNKLPRKINKNIILIKKKKSNSFSIFFLFTKIIHCLCKCIFSKKKILSYLSFHYLYSEKLNDIFLKLFSETKFKNAILNYESIPFQNGVINILNKINKKTKFICYLHCAGWPVQTEFLYKQSKIDSLLVSGRDQKRILVKYLNWPNKKIEIIPSLRFENNEKKLYGGFLFLPFEIFEKQTLLKKIEDFLINLPNKSINELEIRTHPLKKNSKVHKEVKDKIVKLFKKYELKFSNKNKILDTVMFGNATGVCIQAIEEGNRVFHFPEDECLDVFSNKLWPNIIVKKYSKNVYVYNVKKKGLMFNVISKKKKFENYLLPLLK